MIPTLSLYTYSYKKWWWWRCNSEVFEKFKQEVLERWEFLKSIIENAKKDK